MAVDRAYPLPLRERVAAKRPGEGFFSCQSHCNDVSNALGVFENVVIPEPQNTETLRREPLISDRIGAGFGMLTAVRLDDEMCVITNEVRDIRPDWHLPPELRPGELAIAQNAPEPMLGVGHVVAEVTSPANRRRARNFPLTRRPAKPCATLSR